VRSGLGKNNEEQNKKIKKVQWLVVNCDEPHLALNEKTQPIQWTERPTGALVAAGSLSPWKLSLSRNPRPT